MKLQNTLALGFGLILAFSAQSYAAEIVSNPINEDLFFSNGVQLEDVKESGIGVASVSLDGTGSLTVGSQASGGFPRVAVSAGTTITSTRNWPEATVPKTSWDGQFTAPGSGRLPARDEITFAYASNLGNQFEAVDAFVWGLSNETFSFGGGVGRFVFPVDEADGQRLWLATADGESWAVNSQDDYCVVDSGLCYMELSSFGSIALVKQSYEVCPRESVLNGAVGSIPNCIVTCDSGYFVDNEGNECLSEDMDESSQEEGESIESVEADVSIDDLTPAQQDELYAFADDYGYDPLELIRAVPGAVKYRTSADSIRYHLVEYTDLSEEELAKIRHINTGYLARNPRSAAEQLAANEEADPAIKRANDDSFASYLLSMRNRFANQQNEESVDEVVVEEELEEVEDEESVAAADGFHSAGGKMLPSTGPGLFITIAIIGFLLMLFGGIRRN